MEILKSRVKIRSYKFMYWKYLHYVDEPCDDKPCDDEPCDDEPCDDKPCDYEPCDDEPCGGEPRDDSCDDDDGEERKMLKVFTVILSLLHLNISIYFYFVYSDEKRSTDRGHSKNDRSTHPVITQGNVLHGNDEFQSRFLHGKQIRTEIVKWCSTRQRKSLLLAFCTVNPCPWIL